MIRLDDQTFDETVQQAIDGLPRAFAEMLENIVVVVEDTPSAEDLEAVGMAPHEAGELFGLYHGVPLEDRGFEYSGLPDRVVIYRRPILAACQSRREARAEIRDTLIHELGHYFGLSDEDMPY
jgi:predicted Zn-dependent protease with MMP-like domain